MSITQQLRELIDCSIDSSIIKPGARVVLVEQIELAISAVETAAKSCTGCEGKPAGDNVPCAICGKSSVSDEDVERACTRFRRRYYEISASSAALPLVNAWFIESIRAALESFAKRPPAGGEAVAL